MVQIYNPPSFKVGDTIDAIGIALQAEDDAGNVTGPFLLAPGATARAQWRIAATDALVHDYACTITTTVDATVVMLPEVGYADSVNFPPDTLLTFEVEVLSDGKNATLVTGKTYTMPDLCHV
ncbi:hypothetical protein [Hydrocarboniphaga sp.]|uniref:hypothetical protein n=1 Tax=Hydrocarboniphaga sp. TaxID=2033016 RepID=UPI003D09D6A4